MTTKPTPDDLQKLLDNHCAALMEHFDSVTILVTAHDGASEETSSYESSGGNIYARLGKVHEWLAVQDANVKLGVMKGGKSK